MEYYYKIWSILQISPTLQKVFDKKPMITNNTSKILRELIGHTLQGGSLHLHLQIINSESKSHNTINPVPVVRK